MGRSNRDQAVSVTIHRNGKLTPRLSETLNHLLLGRSEKEIAAKLGLSRHTVHTYVTKLYRVHGVDSRAMLMAYFVKSSDKRRPD